MGCLFKSECMENIFIVTMGEADEGGSNVSAHKTLEKANDIAKNLWENAKPSKYDTYHYDEDGTFYGEVGIDIYSVQIMELKD